MAAVSSTELAFRAYLHTAPPARLLRTSCLAPINTINHHHHHLLLLCMCVSCVLCVVLCCVQVLFDKAPNSVWNLRPDSLALMLSLANVGAGSRCLVLENCQVQQCRGVGGGEGEGFWRQGLPCACGGLCIYGSK